MIAKLLAALRFILAALRVYRANAAALRKFAADIETVFRHGDNLAPRGKMDAVMIRAEVLRLNLERPESFDRLSDVELDAIYNGFGPDAWPESLRAVATWWYRHFEPSAGIHDVEYEFSTGSKEDWSAADGRFGRNNSVILADRYPLRKFWLWPERAAAWVKKDLADRLLAVGGWEAYEAAFERQRPNTGD